MKEVQGLTKEEIRERRKQRKGEKVVKEEKEETEDSSDSLKTESSIVNVAKKLPKQSKEKILEMQPEETETSITERPNRKKLQTVDQSEDSELTHLSPETSENNDLFIAKETPSPTSSDIEESSTPLPNKQKVFVVDNQLPPPPKKLPMLDDVVKYEPRYDTTKIINQAELSKLSAPDTANAIAEIVRFKVNQDRSEKASKLIENARDSLRNLTQTGGDDTDFDETKTSIFIGGGNLENKDHIFNKFLNYFGIEIKKIG